MALLSPIGGRRMLTREVLASVTYSLGRFVRAVRTGFSVQVFEMVSAEDVLERARVPEPAWCDAEADVLGEERGGGVNRQRGDVLSSRAVGELAGLGDVGGIIEEGRRSQARRGPRQAGDYSSCMAVRGG